MWLSDMVIHWDCDACTYAHKWIPGIAHDITVTEFLASHIIIPLSPQGL